MTSKSEKIKQYWNQQGKLARESIEKIRVLDGDKNVFQDSQGGTLKDFNLRECEIRALIKYLREGALVLDIGCGSGYATVELAKRCKGLVIKGVDYSEEMIESANQLLFRQETDIKERVAFSLMNVLELNVDEKFDFVLTERCLINLDTWEKQERAIHNVAGLLRDKGFFLMLEGTLQGLENLNRLRAKVGLDVIPVSWHNLFLDEEKLIDFIREKEGLALQEIDNFSSTYMMISRVVHPAIMEPRYDAEINKIALEMPNFGENGYLKIFVMRKEF